MNPKLVLATAPLSLEARYGRFAGAASTEPSFGLLCLAAVARRAGFPVAVVEASSLGLAPAAAADVILAAAPDVVGLSATTLGVVSAARLAEAIKRQRPDAVTLIGGCHATALPEETLRAFPAFDLAVLREGEDTLVDLLQRLERSPRQIPRGVSGTAERDGQGVRVNPVRPPMADLDALPLPAWDLLDGFPRLFRPSPGRLRRWPCASVVLTRGCPNSCTFCDRSVFGRACRGYSPAYAVRLLKDLRDRHGVREVLIEDDTFIIRKDKVREFCELLIRERLDLSWSCLGRANLVEEDLLRLMRRAGCWHISYGIESGDPDILRQVRKNLDLDQIRRAIAASRAAGLRTKGFFMVGFPGETPATLEATRRLVRALPLDDISVMQLTPFPGSALYAEAAGAGAFDRDWTKMNALNTVFVPNGVSREQLDRARGNILRAFYSRPDVLWRQFVHTLSRPRLLLHMIRALLSLVRVAAAPARSASPRQAEAEPRMNPDGHG
jgi:anaerobic magnesium-protoporphyrin IX monomethyl ester cyclase